MLVNFNEPVRNYLQNRQAIDAAVARVLNSGYYILGEHAHLNCGQFLLCVSGSVHVVADDGSHKQEFVLDTPELGLYLPPMTWGVQYKYSSNAVLLVFASHPYEADDYIREYDRFLELAGDTAS